VNWANLLSIGNQWLTGVAVNKSLVAFVAAFVLSALFAFLSVVSQISLLTSLAPEAIGGIALSNVVGVLFDLVCLGVFFGAFYFLGKNNITASKSTIISMLLGVMMGSAILYLSSLFTFNTSFVFYLTLLAGTLVTAVFQYFLPGLTALLFVELRQNKTKGVEEISPNLL